MPVGGTRYQTITTVALLHPCQQIGKCLWRSCQIVAQRCRMTKMRWFAGNHHHDQTGNQCPGFLVPMYVTGTPRLVINQSVGKRASMFGDIDIIGIEMRKRIEAGGWPICHPERIEYMQCSKALPCSRRDPGILAFWIDADDRALRSQQVWNDRTNALAGSGRRHRHQMRWAVIAQQSFGLRIASDDETGTMLPHHRCDVFCTGPACRAEHGLHRHLGDEGPHESEHPEDERQVFCHDQQDLADQSLLQPERPMHHEVEKDNGACIHPADCCTDGSQKWCRHDRLHKAPDRHECTVPPSSLVEWCASSRSVSGSSLSVSLGPVRSADSFDTLVSFCGHRRSTNSSRSASRLR